VYRCVAGKVLIVPETQNVSHQKDRNRLLTKLSQDPVNWNRVHGITRCICARFLARCAFVRGTGNFRGDDYALN